MKISDKENRSIKLVLKVFGFLFAAWFILGEFGVLKFPWTEINPDFIELGFSDPLNYSIHEPNNFIHGVDFWKYGFVGPFDSGDFYSGEFFWCHETNTRTPFIWEKRRAVLNLFPRIEKKYHVMTYAVVCNNKYIVVNTSIKTCDGAPVCAYGPHPFKDASKQKKTQDYIKTWLSF